MNPTDLARRLASDIDPGRVLVSGARGYDNARRVWNGAVEHRPAVVVRCESAADVQAAVLAATEFDAPLSVRGGGHDWAGRALREGGLVIDLTGLRRVVVDPAARVATVAGGALASDVIAAGAPHGLVAATGGTGSVGMAGLTLAGGYGPLAGRFGLALDNLLGAEVVLADGRLVTADADSEPDLYWALRGGGGNFGVVTSMRVRLHPLEQVIAGVIMFPFAEARDVLSGVQAILAGGPDELTVQTGVLSGPDGRPRVFLAPTWSGDPGPGEKAIDELHRLGTTLLSQVAPMGYADLLRLFDPYVVPGNHYAIRTHTVTAYSAGPIAALTHGIDTMSSPLSVIPINHFHGAAARVPATETAFHLRRDHFVVEIVAAWQPNDPKPARHRAWADSVSAKLAPHALPGGYVNLLGPDDRDQIENAYGNNASRLVAIKKRFDPNGIFSATPLPSGTFTTEGRP